MSKQKAVSRPKAGRRRQVRRRASVPARAIVTASGAAKALAPPFRSSIAQLLEAPEFVALVPRLPPETLHALVRHGGLEACGDLIAAATPAQLMSVLDLDLWRHAHVGHDDQFDAHRFGEWLELLAETGARVSARIVAGLDEDLVVAGLSRHIRVFDPAAIARPASIEDDEPSDAGAIPHDGPECEIGGYLVRGTGSGPGTQSSRCSVPWATTIRTAFTP